MIPTSVYLNYCSQNNTFDVFGAGTDECIFFGTKEEVLQWLESNGYTPCNLTEWERK